MSRLRWLRRAALLAVVPAGLLAIPVLGERAATERLEEAGFTWAADSWSAEGWTVRKLARPGLTVREARVAPGWPLLVALDGVDLDVLSLGGGGRDQLARAGGASGPALALTDVTLRAGQHVLAEGLSGQRSDGRLDLGGGGTEVQVAAGTVKLRTAVTDPVPELRGRLEIQAHLGPAGTLTAEVVGRDLVLKHPLLALRGLRLGEVRATLERVDGDRVAGPLVVDGLALTLSGGCDPDCVLTVDLPETPVAEAFAPLQPLVPELRRAERIDGTLAGSISLVRTEGLWGMTDAALELQDLAVAGAVQDLDVLRYGPFAYRVRDAGGDPLVREAGEGTPDWVPLQQVSPWVVPAIQASEDAAFARHRGYDPAQLSEALAADLQAGAVVRGGSTLTQQLAKNLFLSPDRTLVRKVRELLLAAELDRVLGKSRVMELYVNVVEWGPEIWGLRQASDRYFLKQPSRLQPHEAAFLAAILPAPRTFYSDWYLAGRAGRYKVGSVLTNMADLGAMSHRQADRWSREALRFVPPPSGSRDE